MNKSENLTIKEIFKLANESLQKNKLEEALNLYNQVLKINPNHEGTLSNLGVVYKKFENFEEAIDCYEKIIEINPNNVIAHNNLGAVYYDLGKNQKAKNYYEKAIKIDPDYPNAHVNLGNIFKDLKEHQKAKKCYERALEINPNLIIALNNLGNIFLDLKNYQKAKDYYYKSIAINPNLAISYFNLGNAFSELQEYQKAIDYFQKTIDIDSNNVDAYVNLGAQLQKLGEYQKAIELYKTAITLKADKVIAIYNLGVALFATKQYKNASKQFELINYKDSKNFLLACLYNLNDKSNFFKELDNQIKQGHVNAVIGSITSRSEIKYGIKRPNLFCGDPLKYVLKTNLITQYNFKNIFIGPIKNFLKEGIFSSRQQALLTNGQQSAGNLFIKEDYFLDQIKNIIHLEVDKYQDHFKESKEGIIKSWPKSYSISAWIVSMKNGGKLAPHIHDYGWLSGSIYINVPPKLEIDSGNLVLCIDDKQESGIAENISQKKIIEVDTGSLCLFPSSLYHYTIPFESKEDRIVLAFDVLPD
tara:strand:- start:803 stop:2392 length:1590 start_codon:yes stop_codon:yes gene_type:complete